MVKKGSIKPVILIEDRIYTVHDKRVMLDADLARLYGVTTKRLNEQVTRNADRFPEDFAFKPTKQELTNLRSQIATSSGVSEAHGGRRYLPRLFTEHGAIMAASVLNSPAAVEVSVYVVRAFVKLRELTYSQREIQKKLNMIEQKVAGQDQTLGELIDAIRGLMFPPESKRKRPIGFGKWEE
ncbi:MAG: ORF6N domain-containing protein [Pseudomonadales bacterium]|nr:ORF6N domain-containing protein [Pseudomonadales bacterium]